MGETNSYVNSKRDRIIRWVIFPIFIFLWSYLLRRYFFCGFILGDDIEEFALIKNIAEHGANFHGHLQYRFGLWCFNVIGFKLFGVSESSFFLPTWFMSSSLSVIGYFILIRGEWAVDSWQLAVGKKTQSPIPKPRSPIPKLAFLAAIFIASAPFEILIGTVRANDLILAWLLALGFLFFVIFEEKPVRQAILLAFFLWFAFYTKLWAVYLLPGIGVFYLVQIIKKQLWRGLIGFSLTSLFLHCLTCVYWKIKIGLFLPFLTSYSATYPVAGSDLIRTFQFYPKMVLYGSEFDTTLFGIIPYLLLIGILVKVLMLFVLKKYHGCPRFAWFDKLDIYLMVYYSSFFFLLNFFPNSFKFDQYYSAPRIFRYMAPISFPMTLHLAKIMLDFSVYFRVFRWSSENTFGIRRYICPIIFILLIISNIYHADNATKPGQIYRKAMFSILQDIKAQSPPLLLVEAWLGYFVREVYLGQENKEISVPTILHTFNAKDYEKWLKENRDSLPEGAMMVSGLGSYVHYGGHHCGFRLKRFADKLDSKWKLFKGYGMQTYLPLPEPARLWILLNSTDSSVYPYDDPPEIVSAENLFNDGMRRFGRGHYLKARHHYKTVLHDFPDAAVADYALYYYAICYFRESNWNASIIAFNRLIQDYPESLWISGAYYHLGVSRRNLGDIEQARKDFQYVIEHFPSDRNMVKISKERLEEF